MHPVLFSIGNWPISSFGVFLAASFLAAVFVCWRLARAYDLYEEKLMDLAVLTFFGTIIGARLYFVAFHQHLFDTLGKIVLVNTYPGLSFWGGILGGIITLRLFAPRTKQNIWQVADFAAVGALMGLVIGNIGCFFGGCGYGLPSDSLIATSFVGVIGKKFPLQLVDSLVFLVLFWYLWKQVLRFHFTGKIASVFLVVVGIEKFITEFYRGDGQQYKLYYWFSEGHLLSLALVIFGITVYYKQSKRSLIEDAVEVLRVFYSRKRQRALLLRLRKSWYNHTVSLSIKLDRLGKFFKGLPKNLKRKLNVKSNPENFNQS